MGSSDMCQCCLSAGSRKDFYTEYYFDGTREVYFDMLLNTFNIKIPQDFSRKICEECILELRRATEFKMKVIKSTKYLETMKDFKLEDDYDDFDDKISVEFDDSPQPVADESVEHTGQIFVIKLNSKTVIRDHESLNSVAEDADPIEDDLVTTAHHETRLRNKRDDKDQRVTVKQKIKSESQSHRDLKQNSLKLIFNSNLCLFKSLKTKFGCFICSDAFLTMKELRCHSKMHSNAELIKAKFNRLRGLSYHNADISGLECIQCREACFDLTDLKKHLIDRHGEEFGDAEHFLIPYKLEDSFDCVVCNEKFNTYMRLSVHMNNHYSNNVCEICGSSFINRISLRIHLQVRHTEKKCSLCSETFLTNYARVRHMRTYHNTCKSKRYCLICGKTFRYSYQLMEHKILEHGAKRQLSKCSLCPKNFTNTQNLRIHIRSVHVRERNFPCSECDMRFFTKFDQKRHEKTHFDEWLFRCEFCESKFKWKDSLRRHLKRQHSGV